LLPTDYRGLSELGQIAGSGMIIAFLTSITVLPALLALLSPRGEPHSMGFAALAPVDRLLERHRIAAVVLTLLAVLIASPLLMFLPFDFNPLHLRSPKVESVATFLELRKDPKTGVNAVEILAADQDAANTIARRLSELPQVSQTFTLSNLVPGDQDAKMKLIGDAADAIDPSLNPTETDPPATDGENIEALMARGDFRAKVASGGKGEGADAARRLAVALSRLANADPPAREKVEPAIIEPLRMSLDQLRQALKPERISLETIPAEL